MNTGVMNIFRFLSRNFYFQDVCIICLRFTLAVVWNIMIVTWQQKHKKKYDGDDEKSWLWWVVHDCNRNMITHNA